MVPFWKGIALALIACILALTVQKQDKTYAFLVSVVSCMAVTAITVSYMRPVFAFLSDLTSLGDIYADTLSILLRALGVGLTAEVTAMFCTDSGNASLTKSIQLLGGAAILYVSIPLFSAILELIEEIVGEL